MAEDFLTYLRQSDIGSDGDGVEAPRTGLLAERLQLLEGEILNGLNPAQVDAVTTTEGPLAIVAGAGSGKTRVVTHRIAYIIAKGLASPQQILGVTFTNKAANEMATRVHSILGEGLSSGLWVGTFHATCSRILRRYGERVNIKRNFIIYDADDSRTLIKQVMRALNLEIASLSPAQVLAAISRYKNDLLRPEEAPRGTHYQQVIGRIYEEYQENLRGAGALDFGDLIMEAVNLLANHRPTRERLRKRFKYILVDEFQDTNLAQYRLVNLLLGEHGNICIVGDPDQSIYRWRGARVENLNSFLSSAEPKPKVLALEQNYRSTQSILDLANALICFNTVRAKAKSLFTERSQGVSPLVYQASSERDEAHFVAQSIMDHIANEGYDRRDFAVLYRTHAQSRSLEAAMRDFEIPYIIVGGIRFYERKDVKDILAYLRLVANAADEISFTRSLQAPLRGIGVGTRGKIEEFAGREGLSLFSAASDERFLETLPANRRESLREYVQLIKDLQKMAGEHRPTSELITTALNRSNYLEMLRQDGSIEAQSRLENLMELVNAAVEFEGDTPEAKGDLNDFLEAISLITDVDNWDRDADVVNLMTLHAAKGLEFPVIFLVGLEEGLLPHRNSMDEVEELEEERRLCYVGITRAQEHLYLTHASWRRVAGEEQVGMPSRFLQEISSCPVRELSHYEREGSVYE